MGFCYGKRNKLDGDSPPEMKKFLGLEIEDLKKRYSNIKDNRINIIYLEFDTADELRLICNLILIIQFFTNLIYLIEKHLTPINKSSEIKHLILKVTQNYIILKDKDFEPEEVILFYLRNLKFYY